MPLFLERFAISDLFFQICSKESLVILLIKEISEEWFFTSWSGSKPEQMLQRFAGVMRLSGMFCIVELYLRAVKKLSL